MSVLLAAPVMVLGLAACGGDDDASTAADEGTTAPTAEAGGGDYPAGGGDTGGDTGGDDGATSGGATVVAQDFTFKPAELEVEAGATFTFENQDGATHTLTADDGEFDSGDVAAGSQSDLTAPSEPGTYAFRCEIHASMTGTLTVT